MTLVGDSVIMVIAVGVLHRTNEVRRSQVRVGASECLFPPVLRSTRGGKEGVDASSVGVQGRTPEGARGAES